VLRRGGFSSGIGLCLVVSLSCGGPSRPTDVPDTEGSGAAPATSEPEPEPTVPANAPPPAAVGSDEIPDVPPAD
jgi:hypothetical protein